MTRSRISESQVIDRDFVSEDELATASGVLQAQIDERSVIGHAHSTTQSFTLNATDIVNKYVELSSEPSTTMVFVEGGLKGIYDIDYTVVSGTYLSWNGKDWDNVLEAGDILSTLYWF